MALNMTAIEQQELNRIAIWPLTPRAVRMAILMMAGLPRERADGTLDTFSSDERARICQCARQLEWDAGVVAKCAATVAPVVH